MKSGVPGLEILIGDRGDRAMKKAGKGSLLLVMALVLGLGLEASVWAQPKGRGPSPMNLTPEQTAQIFDLREKFNADTVGLRRQLAIKQAELAAMGKAEKPDQNAIEARTKEIKALRDPLQEKITAFGLEVKKIAPDLRMGIDESKGMGHGPRTGTDPGVAPPPSPAKQ